MVNVFCEYCNVYIHRKSLWKHTRSDKQINNLRYEQIENYIDIVEIPAWLFKEKRVRQFVNPFHLKPPVKLNIMLF